MKKTSFDLALSGILCASCVIMMFLVGVFPALLYVFPMICGLIMYVVYYECGTKIALAAFVSVSLMSLLLSPDKESAVLFVAFFGYYPILKVHIDPLKSKTLKLLIKLISFNFSIVASYWLLMNVFSLVDVTDFVGEHSQTLIWAFLAVANVVFLMYDYALLRVALLYRVKLRKLVFKRKR